MEIRKTQKHKYEQVQVGYEEKITYITSDGKEFVNKLFAELHEIDIKTKLIDLYGNLYTYNTELRYFESKEVFDMWLTNDKEWNEDYKYNEEVINKLTFPNWYIIAESEDEENETTNVEIMNIEEYKNKISKFIDDIISKEDI